MFFGASLGAWHAVAKTLSTLGIHIHSGSIHNSQKVEASGHPPRDRNNMWHAHTMEFSLQKEGNSDTWVKPRDTMPSEIRLSQKDKYCTIPTTCGTHGGLERLRNRK